MDTTQYCRSCHRQRPPAHFATYPDHIAGAASAPSAQGEGAAPAQPRPLRSSAPRPQRASSSNSASSQQEKIDLYIGWGAVAVLVGGAALAIWQALRGGAAA